jgi:pheromone a factor receptor
MRFYVSPNTRGFVISHKLISLDFIVQDRRFVIVEDFGCQAAVYPSVPALFLTWFIPLILCMITVFYAGLSFYNYHRRCSFFNQHLNPRSKMTTAMFFRFVCFCLFLILLVAFVTIFDMAARVEGSGLLKFTSWSAVHKDNLVSVISKENKSQSAARARARTEVTWWMAPITSFVLAAVFASTRDCLTAGLDFCASGNEKVTGLFAPKQKFDLPIQYVRLFLFRSFLSLALV